LSCLSCLLKRSAEGVARRGRERAEREAAFELALASMEVERQAILARLRAQLEEASAAVRTRRKRVQVGETMEA
jgi:hypothetical protein